MVGAITKTPGSVRVAPPDRMLFGKNPAPPWKPREIRLSGAPFAGGSPNLRFLVSADAYGKASSNFHCPAGRFGAVHRKDLSEFVRRPIPKRLRPRMLVQLTLTLLLR